MKTSTDIEFKETEIGVIPEDWGIGSLGANTERIFVGRDPEGGKQSHSRERTGYRIIQSAPVFDGHLSEEKVGYISKEAYSGLETASIREDDVLLNQLGDGITFARSCVVPKTIVPAVITRSVGCIRCDRGKLNPWFLNAYLVLPKTKKYVESFNSGSSRRAIDGGKMRSFIIPLPPLKEQKRIGSFYKAIQDKIELNQRRNKSLEAIGKAIFKHWFVDFEFPNEEGKPYKSSGGEMVYNEILGKKLPRDWRMSALDDFIEVLETGSRPVGGVKDIEKGIPSIGAESISQLGVFDFSITKFVGKGFFEEMRSGHVENSDILLYKDGGKPGEHPGKKTMVGRDFPFDHFCINEHVYRLRVCPPLTQHYAYFWLDTPYATGQIIQRATGVAQPGLNRQAVQGIPILEPTNEIISKFSMIAQPLCDRIFENSKESHTLEQIRDSLLPRLISGKMRVPVEAQ